MLRADLPIENSTTPAFPAWARGGARGPGEAAFLAGAALGHLDAIVRSNPPWSGLLRRRLALAAAAASTRRAGRGEDEAALRDALLLRRPSDDPGPAGRILVFWRALASRSAGLWPLSFGEAAEALGFESDESMAAIIAAAHQAAGGNLAAPFAAAQAAALVLDVGAPLSAGARRPRQANREMLALWLADAVLAHRLKWPFALPLLAAHAPTLDRDGLVDSICLAYASAAARACDLSAELGRRAGRLQAVAPKLRAKGAGPALQALLDDDALTAASKFERSQSAHSATLSERGARRLFDRLVAFGAVRELTGRATFRLYGL